MNREQGIREDADFIGQKDSSHREESPKKNFELDLMGETTPNLEVKCLSIHPAQVARVGEDFIAIKNLSRREESPKKF